MSAPTRRRLLAALPAIPLIGLSAPRIVLGTPAVDLPGRAGDAELLRRYSAWLHMERRLLCTSLWPERGHDADRWVPFDRVALSYHLPIGGPPWNAPGVDRAIAVLSAAGVPTHSDEGANA